MKGKIMHIKNYSTEFKHQAVEKFINRGSKSVEQIADSLGTSSKNLYRWKNELGLKTMTKNQQKKNWSAEEKLDAIIQTSSMNENELGQYLRENGLYSHDLMKFKEEALSGFKSSGRPKLDSETLELRKEVKKLSKQILKKDKALAEYGARVILLKKSHEIWGDPEDDE